MKKSILALLPCAALALASCGDATYEAHQTFFYPMNSSGMRFYADQQQDTIHLLSLDSWTLSSSASWLDVTPKSETIAAGKSADTKLTVMTELNTTNAVRLGYIQVQSYDAVAMPVTQTCWLNITVPEPEYYQGSASVAKEYVYDETRTKANFTMQVKALAHDTAVVFTVYQDNATLTSASDWAVPEETTFSAGRHRVKVAMGANTTGAARTGKLTLTSAGISTDINLSQAAE